jgi:hypothetical protein
MTARESRAETPGASLADYLAPLAGPLIHPKLFSRAAWSRCLAVADAIPDYAAFGMLGFELRLDRDSTVDLLVCATRTAAGPRWLHSMAEALASRQPASPWQPLAAFARQWHQGRLTDLVDRVWLEFDCQQDRGITELPIPSVFSSTYPTHTDERVLAADLSAVTDALEILLAKPLTPSLVRILAIIEEALSPGGRTVQVGAMLGRGPAAVRVCVVGPGASALCMVLDRVGWPGAVEQVQSILESLGELSRFLCLDLDVGPTGLAGTAGIEFYVNTSDEPADASQWRPLLSRFEHMNLVTVTKSAALGTYPRVQVSKGFLDRLPAGYARATALLAGHRIGRFVMHLHHIKLTVSYHRPAAAKAYMGLWHEWS